MLRDLEGGRETSYYISVHMSRLRLEGKEGRGNHIRSVLALGRAELRDELKARKIRKI